MRRALLTLLLLAGLGLLGLQAARVRPAPEAPPPTPEAPPPPQTRGPGQIPTLPEASVAWEAPAGQPEVLTVLDARETVPEFLSLAVAGDRVFAASVAGITMLRLEGNVLRREAVTHEGGRGFRTAAVDGHLVVADRNGSVRLFSLRQGGDLWMAWTTRDEQPTNGLDVREGRLYRAVGTEGLKVHPFPPFGPGPLLVHRLEGEARDVQVLPGGLAVVGLAEGGLRVLKVAGDPLAAREVGRLDLPGPVVRMALQGSTLMVAMGARGLAQVDLARPARPRLASVLQTRHAALDLAVRGDLVALAEWEEVSLVRSAGGKLRYVATRPLPFPPSPGLRGQDADHGLVMAVAWAGDRLLAAEWSSLFVLRPGSGPDLEPPEDPLVAAAAAPDFRLPLLGGGEAALEDHRGKPLFLYFFSEG